MSVLVPNKPLRKVAERRLSEGETPALWADRAGIDKRNTSNLQRALGMMRDNCGRVRTEVRSEPEGEQICRALDVAPVEVGL
jgi:hypothetical protein